MRDPLLGGKLEERAPVELAQEHETPAVLQERQHDAAQAGDMRPRNAQERPLAMPKLQAFAEEAGRPMVTVSVRCRVRFDAEPIGVYSLHGEPSAMIDDVRAFADLGVDELVLTFKERGANAIVAAMERFQNEVFSAA